MTIGQNNNNNNFTFTVQPAQNGPSYSPHAGPSFVTPNMSDVPIDPALMPIPGNDEDDSDISNPLGIARAMSILLHTRWLVLDKF